MTTTHVLGPTPRHPLPPTEATAPALRPLTRTECEAWLRARREGRLGYASGSGPRRVVVGYVCTEGTLALVLPEFHPAVGYVLGARVDLEVDGPTPDGGWTSVRVTGVGRAGPRAESATLRPWGATWPAAVAVHVVHVPMALVEGTHRPTQPAPPETATTTAETATAGRPEGRPAVRRQDGLSAAAASGARTA